MIERVPAQEHSAQTALKELERGDITEEEFLDQVRAFDQLTPMRTNAADNLSVLELPAVESRFELSELRFKYYNYLSLTLFHIAQQKGVEGDSQAREYADRAFRAAKIALATAPEDYQEWPDYLEATAAYFALNLQALRSAASRLQYTVTPGSPNLPIIQSLIRGLEERGAVDYAADYHT